MGAFLRSPRDRTRPDDAGLRPGLHRRVPACAGRRLRSCAAGLDEVGGYAVGWWAAPCEVTAPAADQLANSRRPSSEGRSSAA